MPKRPKADIYDIVERIYRMYAEDKMTLIAITEVLKKEGYVISYESVRKSVKSSKEIAGIYKKSLEEARVLIETVRDNPNTDIYEVSNTIIANHIFEYVKQIDELDFENIPDLISSMKQLSDAQVKVAKLRLDYQKGFEAAKNAVIKALQTELKQHPDILHSLLPIVKTLEAKQ